jgi:DNA-directed RNA polymerase specialized sigma24 family protein
VILLYFAIDMVTSSHPITVVPAHVLARRASDLSRRIYTSLPWGFKVANLLVVLASDSLDAFGRVMYAEFIKAAVRGMPDTAPGKPALDLIQEATRKGADALPQGYGKPFATRLYKILLSKFGGDPSLIDEAMSDLMTKAVRGKLHIAIGSSLGAAETYMIVAAQNSVRDLLRSQERKREVPLIRDQSQGETTIDVEDPNAFKALDKAISPSEMAKLLQELEDVHPRAPEWLKARLDGDSGQEISEAWRTTPSYVSKWQRTFLPKIKKVVEHHLREARSMGSGTYDYYR